MTHDIPEIYNYFIPYIDGWVINLNIRYYVEKNKKNHRIEMVQDSN